jgi:uncharacterized protein (DUF342 family)
MDGSTPPQESDKGGLPASPLPQDRVLHNFVGNEFDFRVETRKHGLEVVVSLISKIKGTVLPANAFEQLCNRLGVSGKILTDSIHEVCRAITEGRSLKFVPILEGLNPIPGEDEKLRVLVGNRQGTPGGATSMEDDSFGTALINVIKGEKIAVIVPPTKGTPGKDVFGKEIPPIPGKFLDPRPSAGDNVRTINDGNAFESTISGRILYNREKRVIMVSDLYVIDGNVGLETGDISFVGSVEVRHDVAKGFGIKAGKNLTIFGNVEACTLTAGGDIEIRGGMFGQKIGKIVCHGNLKAKYLDNLQIECMKDMSVKNEIVNCLVSCDGMILMPTGKIIGGECICRNGIEALEVGSEVGTKTEIVVGVSILGLRRQREIDLLLPKLEKKIATLNKNLEPLMEKMGKGEDLSSLQKIQVREWAEELKLLMEELAKMEEESKELLKTTLDEANPLVNVKRTIHPHVTLTFGKVSKPITETMSRPASVILDAATNELHFATLRPLTTHAKKIQGELDRERERRKPKT